MRRLPLRLLPLLLLALALAWPAGASAQENGGNRLPPVARPPGAPVDLARIDAAQRLGVDPAEVQVVRADEVEWPDSSLGCPQPGRFYLQVITPGWLIEVQAGEWLLEYHTTTTGRPLVLCAERPAAPGDAEPIPAPEPMPGPEPLSEEESARPE